MLQSERATQHRARRTRLVGARRRLRQSSSRLFFFVVAVSCCYCLFVSSAVLVQAASLRPHRHLSSKSTTLASKSTTLRRAQEEPVHVTALNNEDNPGSVEPSAKQHADNRSGDTLLDHDDIDAATATTTTQPGAEHRDEVLKTFETTGGPAHATFLSTRLVLGTIVGVIAMIFTAWQMSDFPDGLYASLCRGTIAVIAAVLRVLTAPCRSSFYCAVLGASAQPPRPYSGHMPVATMDYGYKDPSLQFS